MSNSVTRQHSSGTPRRMAFVVEIAMFRMRAALTSWQCYPGEVVPDIVQCAGIT